MSASRFETLGNTVLESHACARAVIVPNAQGFCSTVDHEVNGILYEDKTGCEAALRRFQANPEECRRMGAAGQEKVKENNSMEAVQPHMHAWYCKTIAACNYPNQGSLAWLLSVLLSACFVMPISVASIYLTGIKLKRQPKKMPSAQERTIFIGFSFKMALWNAASTLCLALYFSGRITGTTELYFEFVIAILKCRHELEYPKAFSWDFKVHHVASASAFILVLLDVNGLSTWTWLLVIQQTIHIPMLFQNAKFCTGHNKFLRQLCATAKMLLWAPCSGLRVLCLLYQAFLALLLGQWSTFALLAPFAMVLAVLDVFWSPYEEYQKLASGNLEEWEKMVQLKLWHFDPKLGLGDSSWLNSTAPANAAKNVKRRRSPS